MKQLFKETLFLLFLIFLIISGSCLMTGCNMQVVDLNYEFKYADIEGIGTVEVSTWKDYENSDMVQITSTDGVVYLTHSSNVILRSK